MNYYVTDKPLQKTDDYLNYSNYQEIMTSLLLMKECEVYDRMITLSLSDKPFNQEVFDV